MARRDHCDYPGCTKWARSAQDTRCTEHRGVPLPIDHPAGSFAAALAAGDYDELFGSLTPIIQQAAQESTVDSEIGVLRLTLAKLLAEERDPFRLASGVARISSVIIAAQKANRAISGQTADQLTGAIATILEEMHPA